MGRCHRHRPNVRGIGEVWQLSVSYVESFRRRDSLLGSRRAIREVWYEHLLSHPGGMRVTWMCRCL